jgi:protein-tyrosine phosphatase
MKPYRVLMVCMGNICRSPTAEGVLRERLRAAGLGQHVQVDSAGTHGYHVGDPPDPRSQRHAKRRGYELAPLRARSVCDLDFEQFDLILAMDDANLQWLRAECPKAQHHRLGKLVAYARAAHDGAVPDPYYGEAADFERVLDLVEDACEGLVEHLRLTLGRR